MPVLEGIEEKYINDVKVDKENATVFFNDALHKYYDKNTMEQYASVTQIIGKYENPFDEFFWSSYKTCERLMSSDAFAVLRETLLTTKKWSDMMIKKLNLNEQEFIKTREEIKASYEENRRISCERGTRIHAEREAAFYGCETHELKQFGLGGKFTCKKNYYELNLEKGIYPEFLVSLKSKDGKLRVSGQIDLLIKDGNDIIIIDYKSNREIKKKSYYDANKKSNIMMKYPLNNLMDCNFYHYTLQLSLYAYLLQQINPEFNIKTLQLIHIDHSDKVTVHNCEYLKSDVERMLKHYKKNLAQTEILDRDKPIIF